MITLLYFFPALGFVGAGLLARQLYKIEVRMNEVLRREEEEELQLIIANAQTADRELAAAL